MRWIQNLIWIGTVLLGLAAVTAIFVIVAAVLWALRAVLLVVFVLAVLWCIIFSTPAKTKP